MCNPSLNSHDCSHSLRPLASSTIPKTRGSDAVTPHDGIPLPIQVITINTDRLGYTGGVAADEAQRGPSTTGSLEQRVAKLEAELAAEKAGGRRRVQSSICATL